MEPRYVIYGLVDPVSKLVRYVGCSSRGMVRARDHRSPKAGNNKHKRHWIDGLHRAGLDYESVLLQVSDRDALFDDERWWIAFGRACGWPLTNLTDGGEGTLGYKPTPEAIERIRAANLGTKQSPELIERRIGPLRGRKLSPERVAQIRLTAQREDIRARQSAGNLGKIVSAEAIEKQKASKRAWSPEKRARIGAAVAAANAGRMVRQETRAKLSIALRGKKRTPEQIARRVEARRGWKMTPEQRAKNKVIQRAVAAARPHRTHCKRGHENTPENTHVWTTHGRTRRTCKTCRDAAMARFKAARNAAKGIT